MLKLPIDKLSRSAWSGKLVCLLDPQLTSAPLLTGAASRGCCFWVGARNSGGLVALRNLPIGVMAWQSTLGQMKLHGTRVIRTCSLPCDFWERVDLGAMAMQLGGDDMSLWDCRPPCPRCERLTHFMASAAAGSPMRPLLSVPHDAEEHPLPPEAWMAGWTGRWWR